MALRNSTMGWGLVARLFHWIMAFMILAMLTFGTIMSNTTDIVAKFEMVQTHKSVGFTVFTLGLIRLIWRIVNPSPSLPDTMPRWQVTASNASHVLLYILMIGIPITGWLMVTSSPLNDPGAYPVEVKNMVWGLFEMPDLYPVGDEAFSETMHTIHAILTKGLILLLAVHVIAALKHAFVDKDGVMRRMIRSV